MCGVGTTLEPNCSRCLLLGVKCVQQKTGEDSLTPGELHCDFMTGV